MAEWTLFWMTLVLGNLAAWIFVARRGGLKPPTRAQVRVLTVVTVVVTSCGVAALVAPPRATPPARVAAPAYLVQPEAAPALR
jgi:hypothetical protein